MGLHGALWGSVGSLWGAIGLSGQRLLGVPIIVQASQVGGCPTRGVAMGRYGVPMGLYGVSMGRYGVSMGLYGAL